jgi:hypothetical protein
VPTKSKVRKSQPHVVITGKAVLFIEDGKGILK